MPPAHRDHLLDALAEGIQMLTDSDRWQAHLDVQGRFHHYSFNNTLLIAAQNPDATRVAGFATWKSMGRSVVKGERAIWILAPMVGRRTEIAEGEERRPIYGFRPVAVFDVTQTEGDELPQVCSNLEGEDPAALFDALRGQADRMGYSVELVELPGSTNGACNFAERRIRIESRNQPAQRVKTLAHELAHALLHEEPVDRALAELEAESVAYVVCRTFGLDSGEYSFGYVAGWAGGRLEAIDRITASGRVIQKASSAILDGLEAAVDSDAAAA